MAQQFVRKLSQNIGNTATKIGGYDVPPQSTAVMMGLVLSNTTIGQVTIGVELYDGVNSTFVMKNVALPSGSSMQVNTKIVLRAGDSIRVSSSVANSVDAILSLLEQN